MRHGHHHADLDSPFFWAAILIRCAVAAVVIVAWAVQALFVLPVAGVAKLTHHDATAKRWTRTLGWLT